MDRPAAAEAIDVAREGRRAPRVRHVLFADLDAFFASVEQRNDPSLRGKPVVVGVGPEGRGVVACASYEARAFGVRAGMPAGRAVALCPHAAFVPGDPAEYVAASAQVMAVLSEFSPRVEPVSLDEAFLDMTGCERRHPTWLDAAQAVHDAVRERVGLSVSVGIGGTRTVAAIAASLAKPAGAMEVPRGEEAAFLAGLPVEHLGGVGPRTREALARRSVHTIGDLAALGEDVAAAALGATGRSLWRQARGLDDGIVRSGRGAPRSISRSTSFATDTADRSVIGGTLSYLAQRAAHALRREDLVARTVGVRLRYADFKTVEARRRLPSATDHDREILAAVDGLWPRRHDGRPLRLVGVALLDLEPVGERQLALFGEGAGPGGLDEAVDRVRDRHGFGALVQGVAIERLEASPGVRRGLHPSAEAPRARTRESVGLDSRPPGRAS
jgi:DNA polymerase-4